MPLEQNVVETSLPAADTRVGWRAMLGRGAWTVLLPCVLLVVFWGVVSWQVTESLIGERSARLIEKERELAADAAAAVSANVGATLAYMRGIPTVLAKQSEVQGILSRMGPEVRPSRLPPLQFREQLEKSAHLSAVNRRLESILSDLDVEQILVMNAAGDCVASAGYPQESSPIGVNYTDRKYFQQAMQGEVGRQFAVGRTTNSPGIFYSSAVVLDGRINGVVAVRINVARLSRMGLDRNTLVTDDNEVVVLSENPEFYMKALPGSPLDRLSAKELEGLYQRETIQALKVTPVVVGGAQLLHIDGLEMPMLQASSQASTDLLTVHVFKDVSELWRVRNDRKWLFALVFLAGASFLVGVYASVIYLRRRRQHLLDIARLNAELVKMNEVLLLQARFDTLTGCKNRRYFFESLGLELQRAARFGFPCCLAMIDIDHFKSVNDLYGHAAGDAVLKHFVRTLNACLRSSDILGRLGGEEFALLMPQTMLEGAVELAERVRKTVEHSSAVSGEFEIRFTVSIGVTQWGGDVDDVEAFVARADSAMYAAKHAGRNQVCEEAVGQA